MRLVADSKTAVPSYAASRGELYPVVSMGVAFFALFTKPFVDRAKASPVAGLLALLTYRRTKRSSLTLIKW